MWAVHGLMAAVFGFSALLQLNDPDPWGWVLIYALAAALSALAATGRYPAWRRPVALTIAVSAVAWALAVAFSSPRLPPLWDLVGDWAMYGAGIEERRETLGLLLLACWMAYVALPGRRAVSPGTS
jgi:hypothetical protein